MDNEFLFARQQVAPINRSIFDRPSFSFTTLTESKKKALHETLQNIEKELEEIKLSTECAMEVLTSNQERMPVLHNQIQELKKLLQLNDVSRGTEENSPGAVESSNVTSSSLHQKPTEEIFLDGSHDVINLETEPQPSTSSRPDLLVLPPNANNSSNLARKDIFKRITDSFLGDSSTKKPRWNSTEDCVSAENTENTWKEMLPLVVEEAVKISKGVLTPDELLSYLYLSRDLKNPLALAKVSFTMDISLLHYQLLCLKFNLQKMCEKNLEKSGDVTEFQDRLDVLIALFESRTERNTAQQ